MIGALVRLLVLLLALALCAAAALFVYFSLGQGPSLATMVPTGLDGPVSDDPRRVTFTIRPGQTAAEIGDELQRQGLIRSALAFRFEVESRALSNKLGAGDYELSPSLSTAEIVAVLGRGAIAHGKGLTVVEGWRVDQIARKASDLQLGQPDEILRLVQQPRENGLSPPDPLAASLEGYLFPETYEFDPKASSREIVETMLRQFDRRVDDALRNQAAARGLSLAQAVTLASIVEREAAKPAERPLVASVYLNRLAANMRLQADPTVQYAVANRDLAAAQAYGFWKRDLSPQDLKTDSPFNTYQNGGLPPAPICNPGLDALRAALNPADSRYLYFVARGDGSHAFAESLQEHLANVQKFR
jgi:peptidoglycan lytic transglycosylase G